MLDKLIKLKTKNHTEVPLFFVNFDLVKFKENGAKDSCVAKVHPSLRDDRFVIEQLNSLIEHIMGHQDTLDKLIKLKTKNHTEVPLLFVNFDLVKFQENGAKGSCTANVHPSLRDDPFVIEQLNGLIDHIREHHDMEKLV